MTKEPPRIKPANLSPSDTPLVTYALQKIDENNTRILEIVIHNDRVVEVSTDIESLPMIKASTVANLMTSGRRLNADKTRRRD